MKNNLNRSERKKNIKRKRVQIIFGLIIIMFLCVLISTKLISKKSNDATALNDSKTTTSKGDTKQVPKAENDNKGTSTNKKEVTNNPNVAVTPSKPASTNKTGSFVENSAMTIDQIWTRDGQKIAFLTFDDGPTEETPKILDILDKYNVKATFFILGTSAEAYPEYLKDEVKRGHAIANHSYSHNIHYYGDNTPEAFVQDIQKCDTVLKKVLGQDFKTDTVRFPGGSFTHSAHKAALVNAGFKDIDWNMENGDATRLNVPESELIDNVKKQIVGRQHAVILMHDSATKQTTVDSLPEVIEYLKSEGFKFGVISQEQ